MQCVELDEGLRLTGLQVHEEETSLRLISQIELIDAHG